MLRVSFVRGVLSCSVVALLVLLLPLSAAAHERREVAGGQYLMVVGFLAEPAFAGEQNGLDLRVTKPAASAATPDAGAATPAAGVEQIPVEGLADTLQAEVIFGDQTMALELRPRFRDPGAYAGDFFPSTPGDYTFHIFGTIDGVAIDERFTSAPGGFNPVQDPAPLTFPKAAAADSSGVVATGMITGPGNDAGSVTNVAGAVVFIIGVGLLVTRRLWPRYRTATSTVSRGS